MIQRIARAKMIKVTNPEEKARWAVLVMNALKAEQLIFERNLNSALVLDNLFLAHHLNPFPHWDETP